MAFPSRKAKPKPTGDKIQAMSVVMDEESAMPVWCGFAGPAASQLGLTITCPGPAGRFAWPLVCYCTPEPFHLLQLLLSPKRWSAD
jgi:hypothetical protein